MNCLAKVVFCVYLLRSLHVSVATSSCFCGAVAARFDQSSYSQWFMKSSAAKLPFLRRASCSQNHALK